MSAASLTVDLVHALAWPVVVGGAWLILRHELRGLVRERLTRLEGPGGFKAEFERSKVETEAAAVLVTGQTGTTAGRVGDVPAEIAHRTSADPSGSILAAYELLARELRQRLADDGVDVSKTQGWNANQLAALAARHGVITEHSAESVRGLTVLRNLVAHGQAPGAGPAEAADFLALVEAALYSFRQRGNPWMGKVASGGVRLPLHPLQGHRLRPDAARPEQRRRPTADLQAAIAEVNTSSRVARGYRAAAASPGTRS